MLVDAAAHAKLTGGRFTIAHCPGIVPRMLRLLKLEHALQIQATAASPVADVPDCGRLRRHVS